MTANCVCFFNNEENVVKITTSITQLACGIKSDQETFFQISTILLLTIFWNTLLCSRILNRIYSQIWKRDFWERGTCIHIARDVLIYKRILFMDRHLIVEILQQKSGQTLGFVIFTKLNMLLIQWCLIFSYFWFRNIILKRTSSTIFGLKFHNRRFWKVSSHFDRNYNN